MNQGDSHTNSSPLPTVPSAPPRSSLSSARSHQLRSLLTQILMASQEAIAAFTAVRDPETRAIVDFRCLVVNPAAAALLGQPPAALARIFHLRPYLAATNPALFAALVQVVETGQSWHQVVTWPRVTWPSGDRPTPPQAAPEPPPMPTITCPLTAMKWGDGLTLILRLPADTALAAQLTQRETELQILLDSTQAIPWQVDWPTQRVTTIGPQIETLLGFPQASWTDVATWLSRIHADDRAWVESYCLSQTAAGRDYTLEYRFLAQDGAIVWVRHTVKVVCQHDQPQTLIGFLFDISDQKQTQAELAQAQAAAEQAQITLDQMSQQLQDLTHVDDLTHLANHRRFNDRLQREWQRLARERHPLSLLLCELDHFQAYKDAYGQQASDNNLLQVAQILKTVARRPSDIVARYRDETFAILLPGTHQEGALYVAARIQEKLASLPITHNLSSTRPYLTLSIGIAQLIPTLERSPEILISIADAALGRAKREGRNAIVYESIPE